MKFFWKILIAIFINISIYENLLAVYQEILTKILLLQIDDFYFYPDSPNKKKKFELYEKLTKLNGEKFEPQLLLNVSVENLIKYKKTLEILLPLVEEVADNFEETDEYSILYIKLLEYQKDLASVFSNVEEAIFNKQKSVLNTKTEALIKIIQQKSKDPAVRANRIIMSDEKNSTVNDITAGARCYCCAKESCVVYFGDSWKPAEYALKSIEEKYHQNPHTITQYGLPLFQRKFPAEYSAILSLNLLAQHENRHITQHFENIPQNSTEKERDADTFAAATFPDPYALRGVEKPKQTEKGYLSSEQMRAIGLKRTKNPEQIYETLRYQRELSHMPWNPKLREEIILGKLDDAHTVYSNVPHTAFKPPPLPYDQKLKKESKLRNLLRKITNNKYIGSSEQPKKKQNIYSGVAQAMQNIQKQAQEIPATHSSEHPTDFTERYLPQENPFG